MSIKIKTIKGETFDLPSDYVIEATRTNPLFTKKGSQTVPISFPPTKNNHRLTKHAYRPDNAERPSEKMKVVVDIGATSQTGLLAIQTASESLISANIGWDEAEMYANMNKTLLPDLPNLPVYNAGGNNLDSRRDAMLSHLRDVMNETVETDYAIFPVVLKSEIIGDNNQNFLEIMNDTYVSTIEEFEQALPSNREIGGFRAKVNNRIIQRIHDGDVIPFDVPKSYGVSPFLRVWKVLELIFNHYGFSLENNPFYEHKQLRKLVVLNNTMDAILTGILSFRDLMPDVTVEEFLESLKNRFGLLYFIDSNTRTVHFAFLRDTFSLSNNDGVDLSKYKAAPLTTSYKGNKQLKLVPNNEIDGTATKHDSYKDFLDSFNGHFHDFYHDMPFDDRYSLVFTAWRRVYTSYRHDFSIVNDMSSDFFGWDKKADLPYEEIKFSDLSLPLLDSPGSIPETIGYNLLMYLVGYKHNYSNASVGGIAVEDDQAKAKLAFAFAWGRSDIVPLAHSPAYNYSYASQDNRNWNGRFILDESGRRYDISLYINHEDGLFNRFWKEYDAYLRYSGHEVSALLKMSDFELSRIKPYQKIIIDNQFYILEEVQYQLGRSNKPVEMKLRTARLYEPYDLESDQKILTFTPPKYYWRAVTEQDVYQEDHLTALGYQWWIVGFRSMETDARNSLLLLPPTEAQFLAQEMLVFRYQYEVKWMQHVVELSQTVNQTTTFYPTEII